MTLQPTLPALFATRASSANLRPVVRAMAACAVIVTVEPLLLMLLTRCFHLSLLQEGLADGLLLLLFLVPTLCFALIRPLEQQVARGEALAAELAQSRERLEDRVAERSAELHAANQRIQQSLEKLERSHRDLVVLREMGALLQVCRDMAEAEPLLQGFVRRLFPNESGAVYLFRASRNVLERAVEWGDAHEAVTLAPEDCWALRSGQTYSVAAGEAKPLCAHVQEKGRPTTLCIPLAAHGELSGLLVLSKLAAPGQEDGRPMEETVTSLAAATGQKIALALSNLRLREKLRDQAIRDPLTRLYNRRYFEESFERELARAERRGACVGLIILDVDHFKTFNDTSSHQGGDVVLQNVGQLMMRAARSEDIPCRYGGEEFALLLSEAPLDVVLARAERLRKSVESLQATLRGQLLSRVTISAGVAVYPQHGTTQSELIRAADRALYDAKAQGRNRVVVAQTPGENEREASLIGAEIEGS